MSLVPAEFIPYIKYATPPLVGAFIGYLTNRVAIRMLFRPLRPWHVFGIRVPMTPGVIPSKRGQLADNMGEVVGDHLLTSTEIGNALQEEKFQQHLLNVIAERVGDILHRDLPSLPELIPDKFGMYFSFGMMTVKHQLKASVHEFMESEQFGAKIEEAVDTKLDSFLDREIGDVLSGNEREAAYKFVESSISRMLASPVMEQWINEFIQQHVYGALQQEKNLKEILPESLLELLERSIREQTPNLLKKLAVIIKDPEVRDGIVRGACGGVENFIVSLGPMAPMVQNFITMDVVDQKIREYLDEKEDDIAAWLSSEDLQEKVGVILSERFANFANTPLVNIVNAEDTDKVESFCSQVAKQITLLLQGKEITNGLTAMIKGNIETHLDEGNVKIRTMLTDFIGEEGVTTTRNWVRKESVGLLRSPDTVNTIDAMIDSMVTTIVNKRIGKLSRLLPADVRKEIYVSIQKMASNMLEQEVPGLVASLDIRSIVEDKLNSLDLLRLEKLLLSIMEEQFKYINLFGALLGFLIGCGNMLFLYLT